MLLHRERKFAITNKLQLIEQNWYRKDDCCFSNHSQTLEQSLETKGEHRRPKVLFLADRSVLVTDPHAKDFALFGDARCLVLEEGLPSSMKVGTYNC